MRAWGRGERGQSTVEAVLVTVVMVALIFGGFEFARAVAVKQAMDRAAYEAARYLATHPDPDGAARVARETVGRAILGADPDLLTFRTDWHPGLPYGRTFCVTLEYEFRLDAPLVTRSVRTLRAVHCTVYEVYP